MFLVRRAAHGAFRTVARGGSAGLVLALTAALLAWATERSLASHPSALSSRILASLETEVFGRVASAGYPASELD
jgi:hypothetical protein